MDSQTSTDFRVRIEVPPKRVVQTSPEMLALPEGGKRFISR